MGTKFGRNKVDSINSQRLAQDEMELLKEVVQRRLPAFVHVVQTIDSCRLEENQREEIRLALADEICEAGLDDNGEPDRYGVRLDDVIGKLAYY